jgi:hypothetical protein
MTQKHPIRPELISHMLASHSDQAIFTMAAQWGADMELKACCEWLECNYNYPQVNHPLRAARRPEPPSLKEQALAAQQRMWDGTSNHDDWNLIRRALEQLPDAHYSP